MQAKTCRMFFYWTIKKIGVFIVVFIFSFISYYISSCFAFPANSINSRTGLYSELRMAIFFYVQNEFEFYIFANFNNWILKLFLFFCVLLLKNRWWYLVSSINSSIINDPIIPKMLANEEKTKTWSSGSKSRQQQQIPSLRPHTSNIYLVSWKIYLKSTTKPNQTNKTNNKHFSFTLKC